MDASWNRCSPSDSPPLPPQRPDKAADPPLRMETKSEALKAPLPSGCCMSSSVGVSVPLIEVVELALVRAADEIQEGSVSAQDGRSTKNHVDSMQYARVDVAVLAMFALLLPSTLAER